MLELSKKSHCGMKYTFVNTYDAATKWSFLLCQFFFLTPWLIKVVPKLGIVADLIRETWNKYSLRYLYPGAQIWPGLLCTPLTLVTVINVHVCPVFRSNPVVCRLSPAPTPSSVLFCDLAGTHHHELRMIWDGVICHSVFHGEKCFVIVGRT